MYDNEYRKELVDAMENLSKEGFKCFILKENPSYMYGYVVTPNDNIIYIQRDSFNWRGWTFSLQYVPSRKNGSACQCLEEPVQEINKEIILQAEQEGLKFARKLRAKLYHSSQEFFENKWNIEDLEEVRK